MKQLICEPGNADLKKDGCIAPSITTASCPEHPTTAIITHVDALKKMESSQLSSGIKTIERTNVNS
jgi:hypothetical protein